MVHGLLWQNRNAKQVTGEAVSLALGLWDWAALAQITLTDVSAPPLTPTPPQPPLQCPNAEPLLEPEPDH